MPKALVIGRFQPFHIGHEFLINIALKENDSVTVAIGSSQESRTGKNPFSYNERKKMVQSCFKGIKIISSKDFESDEEWADDLMSKADFDTVYSNNETVSRIFRKRKIAVKKSEEIIGVSGTRIRRMIKNKETYKELIPKPCLEVMEQMGAEKIIQSCL